MDKKLLLTIQSVCNAEGVKVPWDKVGRIMGDRISDGAVIQHLAKLRQRMVSQGLSVPPPLRRGGGTMISTGYSGGSAMARLNHESGMPSVPGKRANENDEEEFDVDKATDMEEEYGQARSKRVKREQKEKISGTGLRKPKSEINVKVEESDEDEGVSRKGKGARGSSLKKYTRGLKQTGIGKGKGLPTQNGSMSDSRARRSSVDYAELNGGYDSNTDYDSGDGEEYVGAGAPYMKFADSDEDEKANKHSGSLSLSATPSKVVVLQVGKLGCSPGFLEDTKRSDSGPVIKSGSTSESDDESEVVTDDDHTSNLDGGMIPPPEYGRSDLLEASYMTPEVNVRYQQSSTFPTVPNVAHVTNEFRTLGHSYGSSTFDNHYWVDSAQHLGSSLSGMALPNSYNHPAISATRITIPQQVNGPNVEMNPPSAASTYSDHTPAMMGENYYTALDEEMMGMDSFNQAYREPTPPDPSLGPDGGFDFFGFH